MNTPFVADCIVDTREDKESIIRDFLTYDAFEEINGVPINRNKFLYLVGEENTGKLQILKQIAQEVFGQSWESKLYLRIDEGQKYPYKLHAHKVESSRKVIFVTKSQTTWVKWKELYPALKTYEFRGAEINATQEGLVSIRYTEYILKRQQRQDLFKQDVKTLFEQNLSNQELLQKLMDRIREDFRDQHNELISSEQS